jgi:hypothetical protein
MKRQLVTGLLVIVAALGACKPKKQGLGKPRDSEQPEVVKAPFDGANATVTISGKPVTLVKGVAEVPSEKSATVTTTRYIGEEAIGDLDGDGHADRAFWISQDAGGSGTFYYVVAALQNKDGYTTTNAFLVGDRIAPESLEIRSDAHEVHVLYADRKPGEPMITRPSEGKVLLLKVNRDGVLEGLMK